MNINRLTSRAGLIALAVLCAGRLWAADPPATTTPAPAAMSVSASAHRAEWQKHFTLGSGDLLNISLYDNPESAQREVPIGPDGHISFLQAQDVMAAGLTIDEFRAKLDESLTNFYRSPRTIVTPAAFRSKKYFVLGTVVNKGVFTFDRPITVIEAIARAGGLETGLYEDRTVELADLGRSMLVRGNQRIPVDFERLFRHGDLSQNVPLEPNDYLYFASADSNEIYVLGEVIAPGVVKYASNPTVLRVVASRGGYTDHAFKSRVLVVRGSLTNPQTFIVDTMDVVSGKVPDFKLMPKDIVYVSRNPWYVALDIVDLAARSFVQSLVVEGTSLHMPAAIK